MKKLLVLLMAFSGANAFAKTIYVCNELTEAETAYQVTFETDGNNVTANVTFGGRTTQDFVGCSYDSLKGRVDCTSRELNGFESITAWNMVLPSHSQLVARATNTSSHTRYVSFLCDEP